MADKPELDLQFIEDFEGCGDCGARRAVLPAPLPEIGDDFDWDVRDYDGFRLFMLEELSARFPERRSWTPADMEVLLVESLSVVLDQLSDMNDRIQAESFLETARRPDTVRRLLQMIGYNPLLHTDSKLLERVSRRLNGSTAAENQRHDNQTLEKLWSYYPHLMEEAKLAGPLSIHQQLRMVTLQDYRDQLLTHPLVADVDAYMKWTGSWNTHYVVVRLIANLQLDDKLSETLVTAGELDQEQAVEIFNEQMADYYQRMEIADVADIEGRSSRFILQQIIKQQRMVGQEVLLENALLVGIVLAVSIGIKGDFYRTEIRDAVSEVLIDQNDGFFAPGNTRFGEDIVSSNIIELLTLLDGVESVCINRIKRVGSIYADQSGSGRIVLQGFEAAVLENDPQKPQRGRLSITLHGGKPG
ncbi:MAG: hypothetical protein ACJAZP_001371 [Psychromonas sp.]|uniref:hypothetical protein n=1 Tax=Psychromonas sp. TaxID=1884585 RepID=UPI0039E6A43A